jgi:hypothetical protein
MAAVLPPRGLPTDKEFFRFSSMRFISRSLCQCRAGVVMESITLTVRVEQLMPSIEVDFNVRLRDWASLPDLCRGGREE